ADVILLTAHPGWESAKEAMRLGAFDYFEKGQEPDGLFQRIDKALQEQASRRQLAPVRLESTPAWPRSVPDGERRYLTVLFADMRESMELLVQKDLEEARQVLDGVIERMMDAVHGAGGTVNQVMGDGIMALFGAPVAQPDHAVRACRAALRMQESVASYAVALRHHRRNVRVQIRVGINSGDLILRAVGSDLRWDYTAVGMPTHIAARMEQIAAPGAILVTRETLKLVESEMRSRPLGRVAVKGVPAGLEAFEILGLRPKPQPSPCESLTPVLLPNLSMRSHYTLPHAWVPRRISAVEPRRSGVAARRSLVRRFRHGSSRRRCRTERHRHPHAGVGRCAKPRRECHVRPATVHGYVSALTRTGSAFREAGFQYDPLELE